MQGNLQVLIEQQREQLKIMLEQQKERTKQEKNPWHKIGCDCPKDDGSVVLICYYNFPPLLCGMAMACFHATPFCCLCLSINNQAHKCNKGFFGSWFKNVMQACLVWYIYTEIGLEGQFQLEGDSLIQWESTNNTLYIVWNFA